VRLLPPSPSHPLTHSTIHYVASTHRTASALGVLDLFVAGAGFDIAGAWLLARGLTTSAEEAARRKIRGRNTFARFDVRSAEDFADGRLGIASLTTGFLIQAVAYVLSAHGAAPLSRTGCIRGARVMPGGSNRSRSRSCTSGAPVGTKQMANQVREDRRDGMGSRSPERARAWDVWRRPQHPRYQREYGDEAAYARRVFDSDSRDYTLDREARPANFQPMAAIDNTHGYFSEVPKPRWRMRRGRLVRERPSATQSGSDEKTARWDWRHGERAPRLGSMSRRFAQSLDAQRDVVIALSAILAGLGALLGAIAATLAGVHHGYDLDASAWFIASMACFAASILILGLLVCGRLVVAYESRVKRDALARFIIDGLAICEEKPADLPAWLARVERWGTRVEVWLDGHLDAVAVARFRNDSEIPSAATHRRACAIVASRSGIRAASSRAI
jgi:hypothetical protein